MCSEVGGSAARSEGVQRGRKVCSEVGRCAARSEGVQRGGGCAVRAKSVQQNKSAVYPRYRYNSMLVLSTKTFILSFTNAQYT